MKSKNMHLLGLMVLFVLSISFAFVSATTTIVAPANSATVSGSTLFNITTTDATDSSADLVNVSIYGKSSLTANNTWSLLAQNNSLNLTDSGNYSINTIDLSVLEDANNYIFNVTIINATDGGFLGSDTNTGVTIDNTGPQTPSITTHTNQQTITTSGTQTFSYTFTDANTPSCTYTINRQNSASDSKSALGSGTYLTSTCSFTKTFSDTTDNGLYYVVATASDETNSTASGSTIINVQLPATNGGLPSGVGSTPDQQGKISIVLWIILALFIVALFIWGAIYFAKK